MVMHMTEAMNRRLDPPQSLSQTLASSSAIEYAGWRTMRDEHIGVGGNEIPFFAQLIFREIENAGVRRNPRRPPKSNSFDRHAGIA